jgi:hypothetical protein
LKGREIELQSSSLGFEENRHELGLEISCLGSQIQTGNEASPEAMLLCRNHRPPPQIENELTVQKIPRSVQLNENYIDSPLQAKPTNGRLHVELCNHGTQKM